MVKKLGDYEIRQRPAKKEKRKGRARGGILLAIKKNLKLDVKWGDETEETIFAQWEEKQREWIWGGGLYET